MFYLHFGIDAVRNLVSELAGAGVRLGQQEGIRQRAILRLHDLKGRQREGREGEYKVRGGMEKSKEEKEREKLMPWKT